MEIFTCLKHINGKRTREAENNVIEKEQNKKEVSTNLFFYDIW